MGFLRFSEHMFESSKQETGSHFRTPQDAEEVLLCPLKNAKTQEIEEIEEGEDSASKMQDDV